MRPEGGPIAAPTGQNPSSSLRLYIARSTPNSVRAEHNLAVALKSIRSGIADPVLEIIDVFTEPKRAIKEGVIVTPTLIGTRLDFRIVLMGDLSDPVKLREVLQGLLAGAPEGSDAVADESAGASAYRLPHLPSDI